MWSLVIPLNGTGISTSPYQKVAPGSTWYNILLDAKVGIVSRRTQLYSTLKPTLIKFSNRREVGLTDSTHLSGTSITIILNPELELIQQFHKLQRKRRPLTKVSSLKGEQKMLYNFIQILVALSALASVLSLIWISQSSIDDKPIILLTVTACGCIIAFALTIIWAGGWVG